MVESQPSPVAKLTVDLQAIAQNWRNLNKLSGKAGAAIKADGYGVGAKEVAKTLFDAGCRDFFVANWKEADRLKATIAEENISILNGINSDNLAYANAHRFKPVLNSPKQISLWRQYGTGDCDVMLDTGINRLGIDKHQLNGVTFDGLTIDICMSHLASADEDSPQNETQRINFDEMAKGIVCKRRSLSNSAGVALGKDYHYDLTRPGLSIYGGVPRAALKHAVTPTVKIEAKVLQIKCVRAGDKIGYNGTYICDKDMMIGTAAIGYADGYLRKFSNIGTVRYNGTEMPIIGRVSMDLIIFDLSNAADLVEGAWVDVDFDLPTASQMSGISQYELLTLLGQRYDRVYI